MKQMLALVIALFTLTACGSSLGVATPTALAKTAIAVRWTDTLSPTVTVSPTVRFTPQPTDTPKPTGTPAPMVLLSTVTPVSVPLSLQGPWGVIQAEDGIWAINADGTGPTRLTPEKSFAAFTAVAVSPSGGQMAYIVATSIEGPDLALRLLSLPTGTVQTITDLQIPKDVKIPSSQGAPADWSFAARQVAEAVSLDWSPDGQRLAFVSAHDGPWANVYTYSVATGKITRLTNRPRHAYNVKWSPDGRYLFFGEANDFGAGAGFAGGAAIIRADRLESQPVWGLNASDSPAEAQSLISWIAPDMLLMESWAQSCGEMKLRTVNISTGKIQVLWPDCFSSLERDPLSGKILLSNSNLFLISPDGSSPKTVASGTHLYIKWAADLKSFLFLGEGLFTASLTGEVAAVPVSLPAATLPVVSPDGRLWAWLPWNNQASQGLWIGKEGQQPTQVFNHPIGYAGWSPDGQALIFSSEGALYVARSPGFSPEVVSTTLNPIQPLTVNWILP